MNGKITLQLGSQMPLPKRRGSLGGGWKNCIQQYDWFSTIGGGEGNQVWAEHAFIGGGFNNFNHSGYGTLGGGHSDTVQSWYSTRSFCP